MGGQDKTRPLWRSYTRCTDGIIFVVDSSDAERLEEAKLELLKICKLTEKHTVPILVLANKQDLPCAMDTARNGVYFIFIVKSLKDKEKSGGHIPQEFKICFFVGGGGGMDFLRDYFT